MAKKKTPQTATFINLTVKKAKELVGWREATNKEKGYKYDGPNGSGRFMLDRNKKNRPFALSLACSYAEQILRGEWAGSWNSPSSTGNGEAFILDWNNDVVSCVHRCVGLILADYKRQKLVAIGAVEKIEELGCKEEIVLKNILLITGIDPASADTNDTGKSRSLGDVLFRRGEFSKDYTESDLKALSTILSVALRHVWLRTNGYRVKGGPKLYHAEAVEFLGKHPLLKEMVIFIHEENSSEDKDNKKPIDRYGFSLGYAAAHGYLAAFGGIDSHSYLEGKRDMSRKPSKSLWDSACEFWTYFAQIDILGKKGTPSAVWTLKTVFNDHKEKKTLLERDGLCCVTTRAIMSYLENPKESVTTNKLRGGVVNTKNELEFVAEFDRFGGLDLDSETLRNLGFAEEKVDAIARSISDTWKVGDTAWVDQPQEEGLEKIPAWFGTITAFSDDGSNAVVLCEDDVTEESDGKYVCALDWLQIEEPVASIKEEVDAEV